MVRAADAVCHGRELRLRPVDRRARSEPAAEAGGAGRLGRREPRNVGLLQVLHVRGTQLQLAAGQLGNRAAARGRGRAADRNLVLRLPEPQLHDRRLSGRVAAGPFFLRLRLLRSALSTTDRRPDRPLQHDRRAACFAGAYLEQVFLGSGAVYPGTGQEGPAGQHDRPGGRRRFRRPGPGRARRLAGRDRLRVPDLLRLLGLFRYGDRAGADARV